MLPDDFDRSLALREQALATHKFLNEVSPTNTTFVMGRSTEDNHLVTYVVFTAYNMGITGDVPLGDKGTGLWSAPSSRDFRTWFSSVLPPDYLCSNFLVERYNQDVAITAILDMHQEWCDEGEVEVLQDFYDRIGADRGPDCTYLGSADVRTLVEKFCESEEDTMDMIPHSKVHRWNEVSLRAYPLEDAAWLVAIQSTFARLFDRIRGGTLWTSSSYHAWLRPYCAEEVTASRCP